MADIKPIKVNAIEKYQIFIEFNDQTQGIVDLQHLASKEVFKYWDFGDNFSKVFINEENNAIAWTETIEIDTLNCYLLIRGINFNEYINVNKSENYAFS